MRKLNKAYSPGSGDVHVERPMPGRGKRRRRIMRTFKLNEISLVDSPAQEGARVLLMKRHEEPPPEPEPDDKGVKKAGDLVSLLTSVEEGHQHGIKVSMGPEGVHVLVMYAQAEGAENSHDHQIARNADGVYEVSMVAGHVHSLDSEAMAAAIQDAVTKSNDPDGGGNEMTDEQKDRLEKLEKQNERLAGIVKMSGEHRAHFDSLKGEEEQDAWLAKSDEDRDAEIAELKKVAEDENPVVYKTAAGIELRKSDGAAVIALAKSNDALVEKNAKLEKRLEDQAFVKRAEEELPHFKGTAEERAQLLKSVEAIEDENVRKATLESLKSADAALADAQTTKGHEFEPEAGTPEDELDKMAKERVESKGEEYAVAYAEVLKTEKGRELYAKSVTK